MAKAIRLRIVQARVARGWTRQDLAHAANLHPATVGRVEECEAVPSDDTRDAIARTLGITPADVLYVEALEPDRAARALAAAEPATAGPAAQAIMAPIITPVEPARKG